MPPSKRDQDREARLAAALRENLKRRKSQDRARVASSDEATAPDDDVSTEAAQKPPSTPR